MSSAQDILDFWFRDTPKESWFRTNPEFDAAIRSRFAEDWARGREGRLEDWENTPEGALALIILFDQFPRNMFRGRKDAFATDALARDIAKRSIARGFDRNAPEEARPFFYLPLMHSEDFADQEECVRLTRAHLGDQHYSMKYALNHLEVIKRFGRFPARNAALGRETVPEEAEFLKTHPAGF